MEVSISQLYEIYLRHPEISKDSRTIDQDCIYFSLSGESFNGNKFAAQALEKGAAFVVVDDPEFYLENDNRYLLVEDSLKSLQDLARMHRSRLDIPVIGITGSNGKTTTKELIHSVLASHYKTFATQGNYNNHIGVPLSILSIDKEIEFAVIEMGANAQGEIAFLSSIANPNYGMITNIGKAHLEGFGGIEGVKKGKSELYKHLQAKDELVFLNADDPTLVKLAKHNRSFTYGTKEKVDCKAILKSSHPNIQGSWEFQGEKGEIDAQIYGSYNFYNMLAAISIGSYFRIPKEKIEKAINQYQSSNNRSEVRKIDDYTIYLDAYNANPSSMSAAIDHFEKLHVKANSKVLILGDMFELGTDAKIEHQRIIQICLEKEFGKIVLVGQNFYQLADSTDQIEFFEHTEDAKKWFDTFEKSDRHFLIKGSRGMALERLLTE